jgi:phosphoglycerate dehydrogenase-like enzyme
MHHMVATKRITFLDEDHVMELIKCLIGWRDPGDIAYAERFFHPEAVDAVTLANFGAGLRSAGVTCVQAPANGVGTVSGSDAILFRRGRVTAEMMDACPDLRLIQRLGESPAGIDLDAAKARGIAISCLPRWTLIHVAEHVMMLMLALSRKLLPGDAAVRHAATEATAGVGDVAYNWTGLSGIGALAGRVIGIVGLGEIGVLLARRAAAFGMTVIYNDREPIGAAREHELGVSFAPLNKLLQTADFVSLHVPGTESNRQLIGQSELALMRPEAILINTARGALVDEVALLDALSEGRLAGAGLDVHAIEPRPAHDRLAALPQVALTPHIGGGSRTGVLAEAAMIVENLEAALAGLPVRHGLVVAAPGG